MDKTGKNESPAGTESLDLYKQVEMQKILNIIEAHKELFHKLAEGICASASVYEKSQGKMTRANPIPNGTCLGLVSCTVALFRTKAFFALRPI